jgi:hypothetical protein
MFGGADGEKIAVEHSLHWPTVLWPLGHHLALFVAVRPLWNRLMRWAKRCCRLHHPLDRRNFDRLNNLQYFHIHNSFFADFLQCFLIHFYTCIPNFEFNAFSPIIISLVPPNLSGIYSISWPIFLFLLPSFPFFQNAITTQLPM